jgi:hypothetical protein
VRRKFSGGGIALVRFFPAALAWQRYGLVFFRGNGLEGAAIEMNCNGVLSKRATVCDSIVRPVGDVAHTVQLSSPVSRLNVENVAARI